ncbi:MAG: hypothetical protein KF812_11485, partial [Fimbriimonadaceae bacterium]|nr:hypothetical protein [Fimbriimonadaceae bacterium]
MIRQIFPIALLHRATTDSRRWLLLASLCMATVCGLSTSAHAQCGPRWLSGKGLAGTDGVVYCSTLWTPPGIGASPRLVVGGTFGIAGTVFAHSIAMYDFQTHEWAAMDSGVEGTVSSLAALPNGDLIVGGLFSHAGGVAARNIARWNGTTWSPLGSGSPNRVGAIRVLNGDVIANGWPGIRRWNGTVWTVLPNGQFGTDTFFVATSGSIFMAGQFASSTTGRNYIVQVDGTTISNMGTGVNGTVWSIEQLPDGRILVGGAFTQAGGKPADHIAIWNGTSWSALGIGLNGDVHATATMLDGSIVAGGDFTLFSSQTSQDNIARWNGFQWIPMDKGVGNVPWALTRLPDGDLVSAGDFSVIAGHQTFSNIARWDRLKWHHLDDNDISPIYAMTTSPVGDVIFVNDTLKSWNGAVWTSVSASGLGIDSSSINTLNTLYTGGIVAGGSFQTIGDTSASNIARWNNFSWSPLGAGVNGTVRASAVLPNGHLIVTGDFSTAGNLPTGPVAEWNGFDWYPLNDLVSGWGSAAVLSPDGTLLLGGGFYLNSEPSRAGILRLDGHQLSRVDDGSFLIRTLAVLQNGDIVGSAGNMPNYIARWNGTQWLPMGSGLSSTARALKTLPNGDLIAVGDFGILRWRNEGWQDLGFGVNNGSVYSIERLANGDLVFGGEFTTAGGIVSAFLAHWTEDSLPWSAVNPFAQSVRAGDTATFSATPGDGYSNVHADWQLETFRNSNSYGSLVDGIIPGSEGAVASIIQPKPTIDSGPSTLTITHATAQLNARRVRVVFSNVCGSSTTTSTNGVCYI